ncbi:histone-lysine N-methyltransferase 2C-like [Hippocampus zosterae]|uniref:histone-lysine N-methyltransferase 2C-like n=1 Tax=Hippocampus zosterae TaxID=109293 RepID=UPI00223DF207|nr:histone-lysine N-methyltransferase 2C-like [Hippocampus zosterae]
MPSEDRRAPPPVTRAGRKAAASEKRPRGRPRRDGVGSRGAPPFHLPPSTSPLPPPSPKSRKKGRSRGQAQVEDEEGVDITDKMRPLRKMAVEVTTGHHGSASRRSSNTAPSVPGTPPADPAVNLAPPPTSISEEEPPQAAPDAPPGPPRSPAPGPNADVGGASLASSPAQSPGPRPEDDDMPSPLLRRSMSEDSGSPTPSLGLTERRLQQCAFCYRGERPPLGQGPLVVFGPTPGYVPLHVLSRRTSSDRDGDCHDHCYPRSHAVHMKSNSPAQCDDESSFQLLEQLGAIGLPHDIDVQSLFDPTGQCCAHLQCAAWSEGVRRGEGQSLLYVDKAIDSGSTQACVFCGGLGASLRCRETGCGRSYHFPCAAAAGAHQDWEQRRTLCTRHAHAESRSCVSCSLGDNVGSLLMCCCCGNRYHARCLAPPLTPSSLIRAGWQCVPCRVCQSCRLREDTSVLLVCARCDKAYHAHCLTPPLNHTPDSNWICQSCRVCLRCGVRSSGHWANHPFLCASCDPALPCGVCGHTPDLYSLQDYVTCICCYRCVHTQCISAEEGIGATKRDGQSYVCPACRPRGAERAAPALVLHSPAQDLQLTPTHAPDFPNPTEVLPVSTTANSPVHLSSSEQTQTPTEITRLSHDIPVASPSGAAELQQSPTRPPTSPPEQKPSPPVSAPSSIELKPNPQSSPSHDTKPQQRLSLEQTPYRSEGSLERSPSDHPDPNQSPESPSDPTELRLRPPQSPSNPTDLQQSLEQSPSNLTDLRQSLLASPANLSASPRSPPPPSSLNHSALHKSPSYGTEPQASLETAPCSPTPFRESPAQSPSEHTNLQPLKSQQAELQLSPVSFIPNTEAVQKSPVRSPSNATDLYLSPLPSPSNVTELRPSAVPFSLEPTAFRPPPVQSPIRNTELRQSPLSCFKVTEFQQSPRPSPSSVTDLGLIPLSSTSKPTDRPQSPLTSTNVQDFHPSPTQSPSNATALHPNPGPFPMVTEIQQTATPSPFKVTELQQSPLPSRSNTSDLQAKLPPCKTDELPRSPVPSPSDTKEILQCPTPTSSKITHLQQSPIPYSPKATEFHQNLVSSPINVTELRRSPVPSPLNIKDLQQSPVPSPVIRAEPQQSPATSPPKVTEIPHGATPLPSQTQDLQQSSKSIPSNVTMIRHSPVPSPSSIAELHHSAVTSPSHIRELHPSPPTFPSDVTNLPSPGTSPCDVTRLRQSLATSPPQVIEIPHCEPPSPSKVTELPPSPTTSPNVTQTQRCPTPWPPDVAEPQQSPATSPPNITELQRSPKPSSHVIQLPPNPIPSPSVTEVPQKPFPFLSTSTALPQIPLPSPSDLTNARLNPVSSQAILTELQLSPATSPSVPAELHESQVPLPSRATEHSQNFNEAREPSAPSYTCGADLEEGALQSLPCPAELLMSHLRCSENAELHECPAMSHLYPIQVKKDPQANHVPWDYQDNHGTSPRTPLSSTPPVLPSVALDLQQRAVLLTSAPSEHSPPSSPPIESSREKPENRASPKGPVRGDTMSELSPCGMDDDEAKPVIISPDSRVQDDCSQPTRPLRPADELLQVQTHQAESFPEAQSPTLAGRSPSQGHKPDVETALDRESDCSPFIACKLERDLSPGSKPSACRPGTVAGSPSRAPLSSTPCNLSQPISPAPQPARPLQPGAVAHQSFAQSSVSQGGGGGTELSPGDIPPNGSMDNSQTLESGLCSSATVTVEPAPLSRPQSEPDDLPSPAPASLVHQSASVDRSSPSPVSCDAGTAEGVPCHFNDSLDCTSQNPTGPVHIHAGARGPADSLHAPYDLMTDAVERLPGGMGPSSQAGSPAMSADRSSQPCASPSSLDATSPQTAVNHGEFEKSPASAGDRSPAGSLYDPELLQLPQTGPSSLSAVPTCSRPTDSKPSHSTRVSPPHSRYAGDGSDGHAPIKIDAEASGCSSDPSSLKTCATFGSPTPARAAETCPGSLTGSTRLSPEADAQAGSPERNSLGRDCAPGLSPPYQLGGSFAASRASTADPRRFPAPLSPWNDRPASGPTQEHANVPETGCPGQTQARTACRSQLADSLRPDNAQISESLEELESSTGSAVPTRVGSESGPCLAAPTSAFLCEGESTTTLATTDQADPLCSRRYLPEKTEGEVPDREHDKQLIDAQKMSRRQEEKEVQSQEKMKEQHQEEIEVERMQEDNRDQRQAEENCEELPSVLPLSADEPAAASAFFCAPPSQSSPNLSGSPAPSPPAFPHWGVTSETFLPLPDAPSEWPQGDRSRSRKTLEAAKDVTGQSHVGSSERDESTPDAAANREGARQSSSDGEGEQEPTLDAEVMKLMCSSSPSASPCHPPSLTPPPLSTRSLRPPPRSVPPLDELSIRLRQSPFSTEASPETSPTPTPIRVSLTPPPLSPPSPPLSFSPPYRESPPLCKTLPSTVIPLTRKIGMGKPAISKRKFSPGRTRVRQASWWSNVRAVSPPSSSQDSPGEGGPDSPKSRRADSPLWSMRAGRGSGFPGRRRSRGGGGIGGGRGGRGRSRIKTQDFVPVSPTYGSVESAPPKEEEENSMHNTVVMFSTSDVFTLRQDMCVVCGSFGRGAEGRLLACSQCGQCYHPYCVNVKVTRVILTKGWRCLECTVCEACGQATDPGRLLLCDDCDISYHTYCLEPPLHTVPKGAWKCKWCVWCVQCGSASPGPHCEWQNNYSRCGPCASLTCCPLCQRAYTHDDLILQCQQCDRWVHAVCEGLTSEDEVEVAADEGFDCSLCRTRSRIPYGRPDNLDMVQILSRTREADTKTYRQDGVFLTESGLSQLQSLVEPLTSTRRYRRCKPKLKLRIINQNSVSVLQTLPDPDAGHVECEIKSDSSPEREQAPEDDVSKDLVKRKRKPYRPGIGGFTVRQRGGKAAAGVIKRCSETPQGDEGDVTPSEDRALFGPYPHPRRPLAEGAEQTADKVKKRYRKKKTKLEEAFPSYLQEAFFGRDLLYRIRQVDQRILSEAARVSRSGAVDSKGPAPSENRMDAKQERPPLSDEALADLCDVLNTHPHIVSGGHAAGPDINEPSVTSELTGSGGQGQKALHEEPLDAILNPELDKMVADGALLSKLYKIPELEGKDVEELFTAVLSPDGGQQHERPTHAGAGSKTYSRAALEGNVVVECGVSAGAGAFPRPAPPNGLAGGAPDLRRSGPTTGVPVCGGAVPRRSPADQRAAEGERDTMSTAQRSMMKWEKEEALGERATVAPVLYCNTNFPQLREQYPEWSTRVKQIAKLWRKASSQDRAPYVQRARDNRAAQRINKVHVCAEPPKQPLHDRVRPDAADSAPKDPFRPRESEREQEWKLRQGEVKDRWRAGKKRQENTDKGCPFQASLAGGGKEAPQMREKSKQLAKMEASQKLEQVKSEQRQQQQQQQQLSASQRGGTSPDAAGRHGLLRGSSPADDVFLRPQAPPPSGYSSHPHSPRSPHSSSSPQMFSPPSSRPASPRDPCNTPRPPLGTSPARDASGSPVPSPDSKACDASRALALQPGLEHSRAAMKSPPSGSQVYPRSPVQGGLFKAPMPPQNQPLQELFDGAALSDPALHPQLGSPRCNTYAPAPRNPGGDYDHQTAEPFVRRSSLSDTYADPPASGPHGDASYLGLERSNTASGRHFRPSLPAHLPGLPGSALTLDRYAQRASTPDPQKTPEAETPRLVPSPLGGEPATRKQQDRFAGTAGTSDRGSAAAAHATAGASPVVKMAADDMVAVGAASSEGAPGLLPQLGDSEEKLRQRQRLRQLILRQQQQKSATRQEKGVHGGPAPALGPAPGSATPGHWPQGVVDEALAEVLGRPPPPYPGTLRLPGPGAFPVERLGGPAPKSSLSPARRGTPSRFGPLNPFPHPPPVSVLGAPARMRKPLPGEPVAAGPQRLDSAAAPRAFPVPARQHGVMGQPYIELRHRAPENRLRLPFPLVAEAPPPSARARGIAAGQPALLTVQLNQQDQRNPLHAAARGNNMALQGAEGMEEHLEGVESAVKDLEDVEVKDLVDLNLNLDPEDGKEDLDLGPNDLHLDDFLLSGKFDLIAYADPELDLEDKKDMFADELDLGESVGDLKQGASQKTDDRTDSRGRVKEENPERIQVDHPTPDGVFGLAGASAPAAGSDLPGSALHLPKVESKGCGILPQARGQGKIASCVPTPPPAPGPQGSSQQGAAGPGSAYLALRPPPSGHGPVPQGVPLDSPSLQLPRPCLLLNPNAQPLQREASAQGQEQEREQIRNQNKGKPLLLEEQPLLLQDLLDQERQEQQQQKQMQALIGHKSAPEPGILDLADFDSVSDPIMKAKMVALKGINKVMSQGNLGLNNMVINRFHPAPPAAAAAAQAAASQPPLPVAQDPDADPQPARPDPPGFGAGFIGESLAMSATRACDALAADDSRRRQYEEWLGETQRLLRMQERLLEEQLGTHRKTKKALSAKQRTAKKAGRALAEDDAAQLGRVLERQAAVQKQLEQIRRQQKDHAALIEDYRSKRQERRPLSNAPATAALPQPLQSAVRDVPPTWSPLMGRTLASHTPTSAGVSAAASFASAVGGPAAGHGGVSPRDASAPAPQVKFDDNNPFSEGFQERERRERLREQQERHRVLLMQQGAERHRMSQQQRPDPVQPRAAGPAVGGGILGPAPGGDAFSQVPFFSSELPQKFLQSPPGTPGGQTGPPFPPPRRGRTGGLGPAGASPERGGLSPDPPPSALAPSTELERQLSACSASRERGAPVAADSPGALLCGSHAQVKEEREERGDPAQSECADPGKELLRHLLKEKALASPGVHRGLSAESARSEDEDGEAFPERATTGPPGVSDASSGKRPRSCKRAGDKNVSKCKRRRREDEEENDDALSCSSSASEPPMTQLSALPLMEPVPGPDLSLFPPYGGSSPGRDSVLSGSFGNACLDGVADYYAQLACKNMLGNPPTPPASLPPTPPPAAKQKLLNGFEAASGKDARHVPPQAGGERGAALGPDPGASRDPFEGGPASEGKEPRGPVDVDVPASLPTPPHNNQEELRTRDWSPGGFVPSSSPESVADAELSRYPDLSFVKTEAPSPCPSPPIPMTPCSRGKGSALKREVKTEPGRQSDLVTVAVALNPSASQNVPAVMAMLAQLLRLPAFVGYRLSLDPLAPPAGVSAPLPEASASGRWQRAALPTAASGDSVRRGRGGRPAVSRPPSCSFCKVLLGNGVRKIKEEGPPSLLFCSPNCSALYSSGPKGGGGGADEPAVPPPPQHRYANNMSSIAVHSLPPAPARSAAASPPPRFPSASVVTMETRPRADGLKVKVKLKPHPQAFPEGKRPKSSRWRRWNANVALSRGPVSDKTAAAPSEEEVDALLKKLGACLRPEPFPADQRRCCFCHQQGDGATDGAARLLNLDLDLWVHLNCALWSSEVYETQAGALINVESALRRGLTLRCAHCQQTGATSGCNRLRCTNTYHFTCAIGARCTFFKDKTMLCQLHRPRAGPAGGGSPSSAPGPPPESPYDSELRCFAVFRRVYVQRDEARQVAAMVQRGERRHSFRVGSLLFCAVGRLLPRQMSAFHDAAAIFPVGYHADRIYWSMRHGDRRCQYMCFIEEREARPLFKVKVVEKGYDEVVLTAPTPKGVWEQILEPVARLRSSGGTLKLFPDFLKGEDLFGLSASAICRIIESLPGVEACERYTFRYGRNPLMEWPLAFNPSGSARSEPKASQAKRPYLLASMAPRCQGSVGAIVGAVPGVISLSPGETVAGAHQGRHSKLAQYRRMKTDWKTNVYLARSRIQGLGLYAARDIEKCTMVIEYIGAIIRSEVANRKERLYESQNRGVYMFRIDNDYVIDATIAGGPARYINHSCAPNCMTEVVSVEKENKIIISSCRRIQRGEELSYDYKFDLEDDQHKIPCHCGAFNCRKWMN